MNDFGKMYEQYFSDVYKYILSISRNESLAKESSLEIHKLLHNLQEPYKEVFSLRVFGELSFQQIAEIFGKSESWARVTFFRAKCKIKEAME